MSASEREQASHPEGSASASAAGAHDSPGVIAPPPLIYLGGLIAGFVLQALLPSDSVPAVIRWPLGGLLAIAGGGLASAFFRAFRRAGTPVSPYDTPTGLVTSGPYRISRNPGYLGMALAYCGIALLADSLWALAILPAVLLIVDRGVVVREERFLARKFGQDYARYMRRTRRWL